MIRLDSGFVATLMMELH